MIYNHLQITIPNSLIWYVQNNFPEIWDVFQDLRFIASLFSGMATSESPFPGSNCHRPEEAEEWAPDFDQLKGREVLFRRLGSVGPLESVGLTPDTPADASFFWFRKPGSSIFFGKTNIPKIPEESTSSRLELFFLTFLAYSTIVPKDIEKKRYHFLIICYLYSKRCSHNIEMTDECSPLLIWQIECYDLNYFVG